MSALLDLLDRLPDDATLPVGFIRQALAEHVAAAGDQDGVADLDVEQAAKAFGRSPSTVRGWCASGKIEGAYRLRGREWRIPRSALRAFQNAEREKHLHKPKPACTGPVDLGGWRKLRGRQ